VVLLISEVIYNPVDSEPAAEWIELYNPSSVTIDLQNYKVGDEETQGGGEGMYRFPGGTDIGPGDSLVIACDAAQFIARYGFAPDYELPEWGSDPAVPDMIVYIGWGNPNFDMNNRGDEVLLLNSADQVVDALSWGNSTWALNPSIPIVVEGHSLERYPANVDTNQASDWIEQAAPNPGGVHNGWFWRFIFWRY
jgi:hypothetical protein